MKSEYLGTYERYITTLILFDLIYLKDFFQEIRLKAKKNGTSEAEEHDNYYKNLLFTSDTAQVNGIIDKYFVEYSPNMIETIDDLIIECLIKIQN